MYRDNERKPSSRDIDNISESNSKNTMNSRTSDYASSDTSGRFSSALSRLKYSDYKPLMRTFTRRFESPPKVNISRKRKIFLSNHLRNFFCSRKRREIARKRRLCQHRLQVQKQRHSQQSHV